MLKLYNVDKRYVEYLRQFDNKVSEGKHKRPYIGVVCVVNGIKYYVPLSSPKPKHRTMRNSKDFHKIHDGRYGAVNFNNMIPVCDCDLLLIDIGSETDAAYKNLLWNQYFEIAKMAKDVRRKAINLYALAQIDDDKLSVGDKKIKARCCDFRMLEEKLSEYVAAKQCCGLKISG